MGSMNCYEGLLDHCMVLGNYPSVKPTLTLTSDWAKCWLRGAVGGQFPRLNLFLKRNYDSLPSPLSFSNKTYNA